VQLLTPNWRVSVLFLKAVRPRAHSWMLSLPVELLGK
jgi:hypothetical protein